MSRQVWADPCNLLHLRLLGGIPPNYLTAMEGRGAAHSEKEEMPNEKTYGVDRDDRRPRGNVEIKKTARVTARIM